MKSLRGIAVLCAAIGLTGCGVEPLAPNLIVQPCTAKSITTRITEMERARIMPKAAQYLAAAPRTVTADIAERSAGGPHDFYSEGDYWWPVEGAPDAPYIRRDGLTNPENFIAHRLSMIQASDITAGLTSAYLMTGDPQYAEAAWVHILAWFVDTDTRMNPNLLYGQAIQGRHMGRSIGVIDTLHLIEMARAAKHLIERVDNPAEEEAAVIAWFTDYSEWLTTHSFGIKESNHPNNHSIAWSLQIASFAALTGDTDMRDRARAKFTDWYLPDMMATDGSFPKELARTKPYGYSLFVLDLMTGIASVGGDYLWRATRSDGASLRTAVDFMTPYVADKDSWPYARDVAYWDDWPVRPAALLLAADAYQDCRYLDIAMAIAADSDVYEVKRNRPIRHPLLWLELE